MKSKYKVNPEYESLFSFSSEKEAVEHNAKILMFRFLDLLQKAANEKHYTRKVLAQKIGTSASYITQLFRGDKLLNLTTLAKFEKALDIEFDIRLKNANQTIAEENIDHYLYKQVKNSDGRLLLLTENPSDQTMDYSDFEDTPEKVTA